MQWAVIKTIVQVVVVSALVAGCASSGYTPGGQITYTAPAKSAPTSLYSHYLNWQGTPYRWGGANKRGIDCSAFVQITLRDVYRRNVPRHTRDQANAGKRVSRGRLKQGDLVFFKTGWSKYHVGVYVGNGEFMHASETKGVTRSSLQSRYWDKHYWKARRIL